MNVVFRKFPEGDVIALLCGTEQECNPGCVMSYMHVGQHGEASIELANDLALAKPEEYDSLLKELRGIYDDEEVNAVLNLDA